MVAVITVSPTHACGVTSANKQLSRSFWPALLLLLSSLLPLKCCTFPRSSRSLPVTAGASGARSLWSPERQPLMLLPAQASLLGWLLQHFWGPGSQEAPGVKPKSAQPSGFSSWSCRPSGLFVSVVRQTDRLPGGANTWLA